MYHYSATKSVDVEAFGGTFSFFGIGTLDSFLTRGNILLGMTDTSPTLVSNDVSFSLEYLSVFLNSF